MEELFINVESQLVSFVDGLNSEDAFVFLFTDLKLLKDLSEVFKVEVLVMVEHPAHLLALLLNLISLLLLLPVISKDVFDLLLVPF